MKTYRVWAKVIGYAYLDVEADSAEEAIAIAEDTDAGYFTDTPDGEFEIMDEDYVEEV